MDPVHQGHLRSALQAPSRAVLVSSSPTTALTPRFRCLSPSPLLPILLSRSKLLPLQWPLLRRWDWPGVTHKGIKTKRTPGLGKMQTSTSGQSPHSPHPNPSSLQEAAGKRGLKRKQLEISGVCKGGGKDPAPHHTPPLQLSTLLPTMATPSAQHRAPRGRVRGDTQNLGLEDAHCAHRQRRLRWTHLASPSWAFSQNRRMPRRTQCISIHLELNNLLHQAAGLHPRAPPPHTEEKTRAKSSQITMRKSWDSGEEGKRCSEVLSRF